MAVGSSLEACLGEGAPGGVGEVVLAIAGAARAIGERIALGTLADLGRAADGAGRSGSINADGDAQTDLDLFANDGLVGAMRAAPVACVASEELDAPLVLDPARPFAVAIDPLDGSSNLDANVSVGTIFSVLPAAPAADDPLDAFLVPGSGQIAAGFVIYGPQTSLVLALGGGGREGVRVFTLDRRAAPETVGFRLALDRLSIPRASREYAINASNHRHWDEGMRAFVDDCVQGVDGPLGQDFNMRWIASLVAEAYRILARGGVFLYPGDRREGYGQGRLRLVYEANPIAFLVEQAGGVATDGARRVLDLTPSSLHQRTPFVFGSSEAVERVGRYAAEPHGPGRSPLFARRGLLRA